MSPLPAGFDSPARESEPYGGFSTFGRPGFNGVAPVDLSAFVGFALVGLLLWFDLGGALALVLLAVAVGLAALSPTASIAAVLASLPLTYSPVTIPGGSFSLLELAILTAIPATALAVALALTSKPGRVRIVGALRPLPVTGAALVLVVAGAGSLVFLADPDRRDESLRDLRWTVVEPLAFFAICRWTFRREDDRRLAVAIFLGTSAVVGAAAIAQVAAGEGGLVADGITRARLAFPHPNNLGFYLERTAVLAAGLALLGRRPRLAAMVASLALAGVVATFSRGAVIATACGLVVVLVAYHRRRAWILFAVGLAAVVILFAATAGGRLADPGGRGGEVTRLPIWRSSVRMVLDHPLTGVGPDQFLYQYWRRYVEPGGWAERQTSHPHNLVLDAWLRLGILGLVALGLLGAAVVRSVRQAGGLPGTQRALAWSAFAALAAGAVHGLIDNGYFLPDLAVLTWFLVALVEGQHAGASTGQLDPPDTRALAAG
jgi:O-antigen ligase